jgi:hypothetical protein
MLFVLFQLFNYTITKQLQKEMKNGYVTSYNTNSNIREKRDI